jgi:toxin FitB
VTPRSGSDLFVVDSTGWLEYKAAAFAQYLEKEDGVVVPSLVIYEVYKQLAKNRGRALADRFVSQALHNRIVPMDETIALAAANASLDHASPARTQSSTRPPVSAGSACHHEYSLSWFARSDYPVAERIPALTTAVRKRPIHAIQFSCYTPHCRNRGKFLGGGQDVAWPRPKVPPNWSSIFI